MLGHEDSQRERVARAATLRKWMRHLQVLTGAALIAGLVAAPTDAFSQQANASRFKTLRSELINAKKPLSLRADERVKVVVTMSTASVAWKCAQRRSITRSVKPTTMRFKRK